jgi:hypothetical protein
MIDMKLFIATIIREDLVAVTKIMEKAQIAVFSVTETIGHKTEHHDYMPGNWFGGNEEGTDALFIFSFTEEDKALHAMQLVKAHNEATKSHFPIRAFIVPVEQTSY